MQTFTAYREAAMRQLSFNAFTIYLEKWLNDIYITDDRLLPAFLYEWNEFDVPVYMTFVDEDPAVPMELYSTPPDDRIGFFIVNVPPVLSSEDIAVVEQWVNYYKFAGTQFTISQYE